MAKIGQELFQSRGIDRTLFCAECGYNLMTRPMIGRCPECGHTYDARSSSRHGILGDETIPWPTSDFFFTLLSVWVTLFLFDQGFEKSAPWFFVFGLPFLVMALMLLRSLWRNMRHAWRLRSLLRQAELQEEDLK